MSAMHTKSCSRSFSSMFTPRKNKWDNMRAEKLTGILLEGHQQKSSKCNRHCLPLVISLSSPSTLAEEWPIPDYRHLHDTQGKTSASVLSAFGKPTNVVEQRNFDQRGTRKQGHIASVNSCLSIPKASSIDKYESKESDCLRVSESTERFLSSTAIAILLYFSRFTSSTHSRPKCRCSWSDALRSPDIAIHDGISP